MLRTFALCFTLLLFNINAILPCKGSKDLDIDITKPASSSIDVFERKPYGIPSRVYVAKDGYRISSVVDGESLLWRQSGSHSCSHAVVTLKDDGSLGSANVYLVDGDGVRMPIYFAKNGGAWTETKEEDFYDAFHQRVLKETLLESIEIDIEKRETCDKYFVTNTSNFPFLVYTPNVGYRISKIFNGMTIWEAKDESERCIYASLYPRYEPKLAYLIVSSWHGQENVYMHKIDYEWVPVQGDEYRNALEKYGLDLSTFDNRVIMDISNIDHTKFQPSIFPVHKRKYSLYIPSPGHTLVKVMDGGVTLWESSDGEYCLHVNLSEIEGEYRIFYLFVYGPKDGRRVIYAKKKGDLWRFVSRREYYSLFTGLSGGERTCKKSQQKLLVSSFRNKQGLRIATYASRVENAKADIILVHGFRGYFMSEFCASSTEWNYRHFGYDLSPAANPLGYYTAPLEPRNADRYRHFFERLVLHGNLLDVSPRYEYEGSFVEALNRFGYNVYGFDLQSQGFSESVGDLRCHAGDFKDHVHDVLQFVSIVKRGKFDDPSEKWDNSSLYENTPTDRRTFLLGFSMGGNIVFRAVQEFHGNAEKGAKFLDGIIVTSGMLNLDNHITNWKKALSLYTLKVAALAMSEVINPYEEFYNYGGHFEPFLRYHDPLQYTQRITFGALNSLFEACKAVNSSCNMKHYPRNLPTLLIHSKGDDICSINGPRNIVENYFKGNKNVNLVELEGTFHFLSSPESMAGVMPYLLNWLNEQSKVAVGKKTKVQNEF
ncbi:conserved hypothetical protein [Theileria equi strain WA]|uniref:Serine aminopeptidase S33 domain-containing protein n=1 Tax=Theileria equi strain WA TaxID=1537102 RepID=L1LAT2_THEEQ|nr:conserved hypothetical protein [Theileria equi strain WA]EKX72436.1 conserved hypothetical protein [Theileria equi strain WA]|eukprot:XP_004831888.1 conserved hypothetical protein [Theileria equi strain WA]